MDPAKPVLVPFDLETITRATRLREDRIEVPDVVYNTLRQAADSPLPPSTAAPIARWVPPQAQPARVPSRTRS